MRLKKEGSEVTTYCSQLKMLAPNGKMRLRDTLDTKGILRLIESVPSPKAEPLKMWLANLGSERIDEVFNPEIARRGGKIAKSTKDNLEKELGETVISNENSLNYKYIDEKLLVDKK